MLTGAWAQPGHTPQARRRHVHADTPEHKHEREYSIARHDSLRPSNMTAAATANCGKAKARQTKAPTEKHHCRTLGRSAAQRAARSPCMRGKTGPSAVRTMALGTHTPAPHKSKNHRWHPANLAQHRTTRLPNNRAICASLPTACRHRPRPPAAPTPACGGKPGGGASYSKRWGRMSTLYKAP